ncbi:unnamed protein product [Ceutorhynchus assimilis]|uniref:DUF7869 domain-containing protein n=1 Tax=Ceutorhynchus assimilis TaxID=467358 RepID=A0A9N9QJP5_9CUCU|nr:unnamed protein product [Ceutorhynchus assimilis]
MGTSTFYMYDEHTAKKGSDEVISFLHHYIQTYLPASVNKLYLFSDNAFAQNKNQTLMKYLFTMVNKNGKISEILHQYPEPGHSFLPCDRSFGLIEKNKRKKERIYLPSEWIKLVQETTKNFRVVPVEQDMILNFSDPFKQLIKSAPKGPKKEKFAISTYRNAEFIAITDISAEVELQALVNHTTHRIIESQIEVFDSVLPSIKDKKISFIHKWGCDGSSAHYTYKQQFSGDPESSKTDFNLFSVCLVPLQMTVENGTILWQNNRTSSTRFCRPVKLIFEKETPELTKQVVTNIKQQIAEIEPTNIQKYQIQIYHTFKMTMIDGKLFSAVSESSTQTSVIRSATPKVMNNLESILDLTPNETLYDCGISTLYAWIRCLECCLHISYKITIKKWQIREDNEKNIVKQRKQEIIRKIKEELNLLVDIPKQGYGTTNDGNTARRFFRRYSVASAITEAKLLATLASDVCGIHYNDINKALDKLITRLQSGQFRIFIELAHDHDENTDGENNNIGYINELAQNANDDEQNNDHISIINELTEDENLNENSV